MLPINSLPFRIFLGAAAGALSMLLFHQTTLQVFYWLGLAPHAAFRLAIVPPFGAPQIVSACFWAALTGAFYGALVRRRGRYAWTSGLILGIVEIGIAWFMIAPLKGLPVAFGWAILPMIRSTTAGLIWGLGVGVLFPALLPRQLHHVGRHSPERQIHA